MGLSELFTSGLLDGLHIWPPSFEGDEHCIYFLAGGSTEWKHFAVPFNNTSEVLKYCEHLIASLDAEIFSTCRVYITKEPPLLDPVLIISATDEPLTGIYLCSFAPYHTKRGALERLRKLYNDERH